MKKNKTKQKKSVKILILNILIIIMLVVMVPMVLYTISEYRDALKDPVKERTFIYCLEDGRFGSLVEHYHSNDGAGVKVSAEMLEYYAAARYYEAAVYYRAFLNAGDEERAAIYLKKMKDAERDLGAMTSVPQKVWKVLGGEKP